FKQKEMLETGIIKLDDYYDYDKVKDCSQSNNIELIQNKKTFLKITKEGRFYNVLNNLKKEIRENLRINNEKLIEIDIANSYWVAFNEYIFDLGFEKFETIKNGKFYEDCMVKFNMKSKEKINIKEAKEILTKQLLFKNYDKRLTNKQKEML